MRERLRGGIRHRISTFFRGNGLGRIDVPPEDMRMLHYLLTDVVEVPTGGFAFDFEDLRRQLHQIFANQQLYYEARDTIGCMRFDRVGIALGFLGRRRRRR